MAPAFACGYGGASADLSAEAQRAEAQSAKAAVAHPGGIYGIRLMDEVMAAYSSRAGSSGPEYKVTTQGVGQYGGDGGGLFVRWHALSHVTMTKIISRDGMTIEVWLRGKQLIEFRGLVLKEWRDRFPRAWRASTLRWHREYNRMLFVFLPLLLFVPIGLLYMSVFACRDRIDPYRLRAYLGVTHVLLLGCVMCVGAFWGSYFLKTRHKFEEELK